MSDDKNTLDKVEEVREQIIEKFGFDEETQSELIEMVTNETLDNQKKQSKAIEQKTKYRQQLIDSGLIDPDTYEPIEKPKADATQEKKPDTKEDTNKQNNNQEVTGLSEEQIEDMVFLNTGGTKEELDVLRKITSVEGKTLAEAKNDAYFTWYKQSQEDKKKQEEAQLGASKGSGGSNVKKKKPLTREEHMAQVANWKPTR